MLKRIFWALLALVLVRFVLPLATIPIAASQLGALSAGQPHCIEVSSDPERWAYRPARNLWDLSATQMLARRDSHGLLPVFHAVLFVANPDAGWGRPAYHRYNWSYWMLRFMPIEGQGHAFLGDVPDCIPHADYLDQLIAGSAS